MIDMYFCLFDRSCVYYYLLLLKVINVASENWVFNIASFLFFSNSNSI